MPLEPCMCKLPYGPYPIAIAAGRRPPEESSLRAVVSPEARRPPPGNSGLSRLSGANPDAGRPFPGPFWDAKALKNPPPTPGLNSSLKKTHLKSKNQLKMQKRGF